MKNKKLLIGLIALLGLVLTIELAVVYYNSNFNPYAFSSFCSVNEFIDCDGIARTVDSQFLGIPLAYWGMFLYAFIILMLFVEKLKGMRFLKFFEVFKNPMSYISALGLLSFLISMTLFGISIFHIKKLCVLCLATYILNLVIALIATSWGEGAFKKSFKDSFVDFVDALKNKWYALAFAVIALIVAGALYYTTTSYVFTPQVKAYNNIIRYAEMKKNPYKVVGNILGDKDAKLVVETYSDYECPICPAQNIMLHKAAKELKGVRFVHHQLPLDMTCNKFIKQPFHINSCNMAKFAMAAEIQEHGWDFGNELFAKKPETENQIIDLAKEFGLDVDKLISDAHSKAIAEQLQKEIENSSKLGINGTPAMIINGQVSVGIKPYPEFKEMLINAGAQKR